MCPTSARDTPRPASGKLSQLSNKLSLSCFRDVECYNIDNAPYYKCGVCPAGLTGNGTWCNDLDECDLADPCDVAATCYNLIPGFRCGP